MLAVAALALVAGRAEAQQIVQQTYRWQISNGVVVGGATSDWSAACGTTLSGSTSRITVMDANAFGCASTTITDSTGGDVQPYHPYLTLVRSTSYPSATFVTGSTFVARLMGSTASGVADFQLGYEMSGVFTGFGVPTEQVYTSTNTTYTIGLSGQSGTVPAGGSLAFRLRKLPQGTSTLTLALGTNAGGSGTLTVVEKTIAIAAAANPGGSTIGRNGVAPLDAFTLTVSGGPADVTSVSFGLTGAASAANVFVNDSASCTGTTYGTAQSPGASGGIDTRTPGLSVASGATTLYLCMTASATAGTVTGWASTLSTPGFAVSGTSSAGTSVTVTPPTIAISAAANPGPATLSELEVAALDAFTLTVNGGPAIVSSVSFSGLTGSASVSKLFVNDSATCTGTTYGTRLLPGASGAIDTSGLSVDTGTKTLYLCMAASATAGSVTGYASNVAATGFAVSGTSSAGTTVTVNDTPPSLTVANVTPEPGGASVALDVAAPLDAFTLHVHAGPATVSYVSFSLGGTLASVSNVFVNDSATCAGNTYGTLVPTASTGLISTSDLIVPSGTTTLYLCMSGSATAGSVTGYATGVVAPGFPVSGSSSAGTTVNVYVPALAVGAAGNPGGSTITVGKSAVLDAFTAVPSGGAVTVRSVSFSVGGALSSIATLFVNGESNCTGATYGRFPIPTATGAITTSGLLLSASTTLYLCMEASNAGGSVTGYVTGVSANCSASGGSSAGTTVTVTASTPAVRPMVSIVNPGDGAVVSSTASYRVQVRVFDRNSLRAVTSVQLSTDGGASYPLAMTLNSNYATSNGRASLYEVTIANPPQGTYTLRARATNAAGSTDSNAVAITSIAGTGDGNLLVRDNSSQICSDCHAHESHSSETLGTAAGIWATTCRDCHAPHGTRNVALIRQSIATPSSGTKAVGFVKKTGDSGAAGVSGGNPTPVASFVNSDNSGPCQVCHTKTAGAGKRWTNTGNDDKDHWSTTGPSGTATCTASSCHSHARGFAAPESKGGSACKSCHTATATAMDGTSAGPKPSRHKLDGFTDGFQDPAGGGNWAGTTSLSDIQPAQRSCVNMCHQDHVHNAPGQTQHAPNVSTDASTQTARAVTRSTVTEPDDPLFGTITGPAGASSTTDFDGSKAKFGLCLSCHVKPIAAQTTLPGETKPKPPVAGAAYNGGAHNFTTNTVGATTYTWEYRMHDGSAFARNCTKCHASREEGRTPSWSGSITSVHGTDDPNLLAGNTNPGAVGDTVDGYVCYSCHGSGSSPAAGSGGDRSGKDVRSVVESKTYYHPVNLDAAHDIGKEWSATYADGSFTGPNRHANCSDCHNPHAAGKTKLAAPTSPVPATRNALPSGSPLTGAFGVQYGPDAGKTYPALWTVPTAANFSQFPVTATREYELCFKCHSSFAFGATPPAVGPGGIGPPTDLALEFNPNNRSGHPVLRGLENYAGSSAPRSLTTGQLLSPWNAAGSATNQTGVGYQTMTCGDCHDTDSASPAVQGPHGSAVKFMLSGTNRQWPTQADGVTPWALTNNTTGLGTANGLFCYNCHPSSALHVPHSEGGHRENVVMKCVMCHVVVPHGSKMSRLIGSKTAPAPYRHPDIEIERFTKGTTLSDYGTGSCRAACYPDHQGAAATETW